MKLRNAIIVVLLVSLFLIGCNKQAANPPTSQKPPAKTAQLSGKDLYTKNCAGCHGATGPRKGPGNSSGVQDIIKNGKGSMPAFSNKLNDTQIKAIGDYVVSLKK